MLAPFLFIFPSKTSRKRCSIFKKYDVPFYSHQIGEDLVITTYLWDRKCAGVWVPVPMTFYPCVDDQAPQMVNYHSR